MSKRIPPELRKHPGSAGHDPELVAQICALNEEQGLTALAISRTLGMGLGQVDGILRRNGCTRGFA